MKMWLFFLMSAMAQAGAAETDPVPAKKCQLIYAVLAEVAALRKEASNNIGGNFGGSHSVGFTARRRIAEYGAELVQRLGSEEGPSLERAILELALDMDEMPPIRQMAIRNLPHLTRNLESVRAMVLQKVEEGLLEIEHDLAVEKMIGDQMAGAQSERPGAVFYDRQSIKASIAAGHEDLIYWGENSGQLRDENPATWYQLLKRTLRLQLAGSPRAENLLESMLEGDFAKHPDGAVNLISHLAATSDLNGGEKIKLLHHVDWGTLSDKSPELAFAFAQVSRKILLPELLYQLQDLSTVQLNLPEYQTIWMRGAIADPHLVLDIFTKLQTTFGLKKLYESEDMNVVLETLLSVEGRDQPTYRPLETPWIRGYINHLLSLSTASGTALDRITKNLSRLTGQDLRQPIHELRPATEAEYEAYAPLIEAFGAVRSEVLDMNRPRKPRNELIKNLSVLIAQKRSQVTTPEDIRLYSQLLADLEAYKNSRTASPISAQRTMWNIFAAWSYRTLPTEGHQQVQLPAELIQQLETHPHLYGPTAENLYRFTAYP